MDVSERHIVPVQSEAREIRHADRPHPRVGEHLFAPLLRDAVAKIEVAHRDLRNVLGAFPRHRLKELFVRERIARLDARFVEGEFVERIPQGQTLSHFALLQERNGRHGRKGTTLSVSHDDRLLLGRRPRDDRAHASEHFGRSGKKGLRVVVARRHDDGLQGRRRGALKKAVVKPLRGDRRHRNVEDVARDEKDVGTALLDFFEKPVEKENEVLGAIPVAEHLAEVPVGSVENAHEPSVVGREKRF